jgi:hypothetical protein
MPREQRPSDDMDFEIAEPPAERDVLRGVNRWSLNTSIECSL